MPDILPLGDPSAASVSPAEFLHDQRAVGRPQLTALDLEQLLLDMDGLSKVLSRSPASLYRDYAAGRLPAGLKLGGSRRWRYREIVAWVEAGCPCRREWEARNLTGIATAGPGKAGRGAN
jgi:predicted DNA-binding transcriptional regulator AlpA